MLCFSYDGVPPREVALSPLHGAVIVAGGALVVWGMNTQGQLGSAVMSDPMLPHSVLGLAGVVSVACGWEHTVLVTESGEVLTTGGNRHGQLGIDHTSCRSVDNFHRLPLEQAPSMIQAAAGLYHTLVRAASGELWSWGACKDGQLAREDLPVGCRIAAPGQSNLGGEGVLGVVAGKRHSAVLTGSAVRVCGAGRSCKGGWHGDGSEPRELRAPEGGGALVQLVSGWTHCVVRYSMC